MEQNTEKQPGRGLAARRFAWRDEKWRERRLAGWSKRISRDELQRLEKWHGFRQVQDLPF